MGPSRSGHPRRCWAEPRLFGNCLSVATVGSHRRGGAQMAGGGDGWQVVQHGKRGNNIRFAAFGTGQGGAGAGPAPSESFQWACGTCRTKANWATRA
eukprot:2362151-Pyramimonas_sp.AAC.1